MTKVDAAADPLAERFAALYDTYAGMLYRYALRRLGPVLAEDLVADTFVAAMAVWSGYDPERGEVRPWLFGILSHRIARHHRDELARLRGLAAVPAPGPELDPADRVAETVSADAVRGALAAALAALKPADRDVVLLIAWADLSYPEVAAVLRIPVGTVRSRLHRARRILRDRLPELEKGD